ncbi:MAG: TonB-dependent receptor [Rikenellaceae bacterium]
MKSRLLDFQVVKRLVLTTLFCTLLSITSAFAQGRGELTGTVVDPQGEPIVGAAVEIKDTQLGTLTDVDGTYSIRVAPNQTLIVSYMGYVTQEVAVNNRTKLDIVLEEDSQAIDDVVVVGYGSVRRSDLTGSVGSITAEALTVSSKSNVLNAMQGQVAGVYISATNSRPGEGFDMVIRGNSSISGTNTPLVVIDGVTGADLESVNPEDIESLDILKDASATAIYGSRGANGVIIVTTKRGKAGTLNVRYSGYVGIKSLTNLPNFTDGDQYVDLAMEYYRTADASGDAKWDGSATYRELSAAFTDPSELKAVETGNYYDWIGETSQHGIMTSHTISATGGTEKAQYAFGAGYYDETGMMAPERYTRYSVRASADVKANDRFKFGVSTYLTYSDTEDGNNDLWQDLYRMRPTQHPYDLVTGEQTWKYSSNNLFNPQVTQNNIRENTIAMKMNANAYIDYSPVEGLSLKSMFAPSLDASRYGRFRGTWTKALQGTSQPVVIGNTKLNVDYVWDNIANYNKTFGKHGLDLTGVFSVSRDQYEYYYFSVKDLPYDSYWNAIGTGTVSSISSSYTQSQLMSYLARVNYTYDDRFLLTASGRYDGSSKLAEGSKWGFFPSAAAAWRVSEEDFMESTKNWLTNLKLRLSYGIIGNDSISAYQTAGTLTSTSYTFGDSSAIGFVPGTLATYDLTWEKTREYNVGLDLGVLNNRITLSLDYYDRLTYDLIMSRSMSVHTGFSSVKDNVGSVKNSGIEVGLNTVNIRTKDFSWSTSFNIAYNKNQIWDLDYKEDLGVYSGQLEGMQGDYSNGWIIGQPISANWTYICSGVWQQDEAEAAAVYGQTPGQWKVIDYNGDGAITSGDDQNIYGKSDPDLVGGMTNSFTYKKFDLSVQMHFATGSTARSQLMCGYTGENVQSNFKNLVHDYWTPENPTNSWAQPGNQGSYRNGASQIYLNANYMKISLINLGYTFNSEDLAKINLGSIRIYGTVQNPFVFTNYLGLDPEDPLETSLGQESIMYTSYMFGVDISF